MDFLRPFKKAVDAAAEAALLSAPAYKAAGVATASVYAPPAAPFLAVIPPATFLSLSPVGATLVASSPRYREAVRGELEEDIDYVKLGEMAALAALRKGK